MAKKKETAMFEFNHRCRIPEALGEPGEVKEIPLEVARKLESRKGGRILPGHQAEEEPAAPPEPPSA